VRTATADLSPTGFITIDNRSVKAELSLIAFDTILHTVIVCQSRKGVEGKTLKMQP
jgi:hypothetical protein